MSDATGMVTILRAHGRRLAKYVRSDGTVESHDSAKTFDMSEHIVASLDDLHSVLADLASRADRCVVRGAIADPTRTRGVRRLLHADPETGEQPTLRDVPRRWVALDLDSVPLPGYVNRESLFECGMHVSGLIPQEFRGCGFVVQATAQHCIAEGARLRLWFWLNRAVIGAELKHWFRGCPVDFSAFTTAQTCYTSSPIFETGADILRKRLELMPGPSSVHVPAPEALRPPPAPPPKPLPEIGDSRAENYARAAMTNAASRILAAPIGNRHRTILAEARSLHRLAAGGAVSEAHVRSVIENAAVASGKTDLREIAALLGWAAQHTSGAAAHG